MSRSRACLVIFGLLDAVLLGRFADAVCLPDFSAEIPWWFQTLELLRPVFLLSLGFSAFGLASECKWGVILSYIQFPFRFVFVLFSFGFLTLLTPLVPGFLGYRSLLVTAMALECGRLVTTILVHRRLRAP